MDGYGLLDVVMVLFAVQILRIYLAAFYPHNSGRKLRRYVLWGMYIVLQYLVMVFALRYSPIIFFMNIFLITLIQVVSSSGNFKTALFRSGVFCVLWMAMEVITQNILLLIGTDGDHLFIVGNLISKIIMYLGVQVHRHWCMEENAAPRSLWCRVQLLLVPVSTACIIYGAYALTLRSGLYMVFSTVSVLMLLINCVIFDNYEKMGAQRLMERQNKEYEQELRLYMRQTANREEAYRQTRILQHDLNDRLVAVSALLGAGRSEEAADEIRKMIGENRLLRREIAHSGNLALDAMVNYKYSAAVAEGAMLKCCIEVPAEISVDSTDLCVILGNLLDNALEAVRVLPEGDRQVGLTVRLSKGTLFIAVENPYRGEVAVDGRGRIHSSKSGDHGIGLFSVERTAAKYDGDVSIKYDSGMFRAFVVLCPKSVRTAHLL